MTLRTFHPGPAGNMSANILGMSNLQDQHLVFAPSFQCLYDHRKHATDFNRVLLLFIDSAASQKEYKHLGLLLDEMLPEIRVCNIINESVEVTGRAACGDLIPDLYIAKFISSSTCDKLNTVLSRLGLIKSLTVIYLYLRPLLPVQIHKI